MRWIGYIGMALFLAFVVLGYSYFYPSRSPISSMTWFQNYVVANLDAVLKNQSSGDLSGELIALQGELKYKSDSDFSFYFAQGGQKFFGKTLISSGSASKAKIEVAGGVEVELDENSLLIIEPPSTQNPDETLIRVVGGVVVAKQVKESKKVVKVVNRDGLEKKVDRRGVAAVAESGFLGEAARIEQEKAKAARELEAKRQAEQKLLAERRAAELAAQREQARLAAEKEARQKEFVFEDTVELSSERAPASFEESSVSVKLPSKIGKRDFDPKLVAPPKSKPKTSIARGIYEARRGNANEATREFASAVASPLYSASSSFTPNIALAMSGIVESYVNNRECEKAKDTIANVRKQYSTDSTAIRWVQSWDARLKKSRCSR